jgi:hypothetical protein
MAYIEILDTEVGPEAPIKQWLMRALRDNPAELLALRSAHAVKTAAETVTGSATLQDDDHLTFAASANTLWLVRLYLTVTTPTARGLKVQIAAPAGASGGVGGFALTGTSPITAARLLTGSVNSAIDVFGGAEPLGSVYLEAPVQVDATAGDIKLQWAQQSSGAGDTILDAGCTLVAQRLDIA